MKNQILNAEYAKREENIVFEGSHKGINYFITENDYERREISHTPSEVGKFEANPTILLEILQKHYGNKPSAGVPDDAGHSEMHEVYIDQNTVIDDSTGLEYTMMNGKLHLVKREGDKMYLVEVPIQKPYVNENKVGRNEPCPCGSGKKSKKCCK